MSRTLIPLRIDCIISWEDSLINKPLRSWTSNVNSAWNYLEQGQSEECMQFRTRGFRAKELTVNSLI